MMSTKIPLYFPGADIRPIPPNRQGKDWAGTGGRKLVLHTLEWNGWLRDPGTHPDEPWRWHTALPHVVVNPNTREVRQHVPFDRAAYAIRTNDWEDDEYVWQVELWGRAKNVPGYDDNWYSGVAWFIDQVHKLLGVPLSFADFSVMEYGEYAPQRMNYQTFKRFSGVLGHAHVGRGVDTHWDPGRLDVARVVRFLEGDTMPRWQFANMVNALFEGRPDEFRGADPGWFYRLTTDDPPGIYDDPDAPDWANFWRAFARVISGE